MKPVLCPKCHLDQPLEALASEVPFFCTRCHSRLRTIVFPAIHRDIAAGALAEKAVLDSEATCFFHTDKKAAIACDECGRFLCSLCDVTIGARHLCPRCIETGREKKTLTTLETYRASYPNLALTLALLPILFWPITFITGPIAVFLAIYGWNKPPSLTGKKRRFALIAAFLIGLVECVGWAFVVFGIYSAATRG